MCPFRLWSVPLLSWCQNLHKLTLLTHAHNTGNSWCCTVGSKTGRYLKSEKGLLELEQQIPFRQRAKAHHWVTNRTRDSFRGVVCIIIGLFQPKWFYNSDCVTGQHQVELVDRCAVSHNTPVTVMLARCFISKPQMAFIQNPRVKTSTKCWVTESFLPVESSSQLQFQLQPVSF